MSTLSANGSAAARDDRGPNHSVQTVIHNGLPFTTDSRILCKECLCNVTSIVLDGIVISVGWTSVGWQQVDVDGFSKTENGNDLIHEVCVTDVTVGKHEACVGHGLMSKMTNSSKITKVELK